MHGVGRFQEDLEIHVLVLLWLIAKLAKLANLSIFALNWEIKASG